MGRPPSHLGSRVALLCRLPLLLLLAATAGSAQPAAQAQPSDRAEILAALIERAASAGLHADPVWLALLQVDPGVLGLGRKSSVSTQSFFLSPRGARDPEAELEATLAGFLAPDFLAGREDHPQCAFIARRNWLIEQLQIRDDEMPRVACEHYEQWRLGLGAKGLTLIYPEGFMNNPASMFGHTLLRIDIATDREVEEILGHAVDFTGEPGEDRGLALVLRGMLGRYPGRFAVHPYYEQLRRYAEWEHRDIWEYRLDVAAEELDFLLMHLWELRGIDHPYYFFTQNCSYHLLRLLALSQPALREHLTWRPLVIPIDTVRSALAIPGFVTNVRYRASPATRLELDLERSPPAVREIARRIARGVLAPASGELEALAADDRVAALEIAYALLRHAFVRGSREPAGSQGLARRILIARSKLARRGTGERRREPAPLPVRPDRGHASAAASVGGGFRDDEAYLDFGFRPAFHALMDREAGYPRHMQIRFLDAKLRYFPERGRVHLQELNLFEAVSLSPRGEISRPFAWSLSAGLATRRVARGGGPRDKLEGKLEDKLKDKAIARVDVAAGLAAAPRRWLHLYGLATATVDAGPGLSRDFSLGPGVRSGAYLSWPRDLVKSHFFAELRGFVVGDRTLRLRTGTQQRLTLSRNTALLLQASYNRVAGKGYLQADLSLQVHF